MRREGVDEGVSSHHNKLIASLVALPAAWATTIPPPLRPSIYPPIISLPTLRPMNDESAQSEEHPPKPRSGCAASQAAWSNIMQGWPRRESVLHHINQKLSSRLYSVHLYCAQSR